MAIQTYLKQWKALLLDLQFLQSVLKGGCKCFIYGAVIFVYLQQTIHYK